MSNHVYDKKQLTDEEKYWLGKLSSDMHMSSFAVTNHIVDSGNPKRFFYTYHLPDEISHKITMISNRSEYGVFIILLCGVQYLLSMYSGNKDVAIGIPVLKSKSGATFQDNPLIIRNQVHSKMTFRELLFEVQQTVTESNKNQNISHRKLAQLLGLETGTKELLKPRTMVLLENIQLSNYVYNAYADMVFNFKLSGDQIECFISYKTESMGEMVKGITNHLTCFFKAVVNNPNIPLSEIDMLSEERNRILYEFNDSISDYPKDKSVVELFEMQVKKTPDKTAVVYQDKQLTYKELNEKANHLARVLVDHGVGEDVVVGIMLDRSLELLIGMLGVLKAGGAYLPIDPNYPEERIEYLLTSSNADIVLKTSKLENEHACSLVRSIDIDTLLENSTSEVVGNLDISYDPEGLQYVLYTSGSTGEPKGVMVKRNSFVNLLHWYTSEFQISDTDRVLLIAPISFDTSHKNIFAPLINGGQLHLFTAGIYDYNEMSEVIHQNRITLVNCTPSGFYPVVDYNENTNYQRLTSLKHVVLGGEAINLKKLTPWMKSTNFKSEIVNTYGPTECTDLASFYRIDLEEMQYLETVPIGKPIFNSQIYIVDSEMNLLPIGIVGELCIGGTGLSRGYYRAPELTREKFVEIPQLLGKKVYKTGDLARWMPDGNIEFIGRKDYQTKIRGFRVELGELETRLLKHEDIVEAAVVALDDSVGTKILSAYYVAKQKLTSAELRQFLSLNLPDFMIPAYFTQLEKMPLNHNGKIDRKSLPVPNLGIMTSSNYVAPQDEIEQKLVSIWQEVLGIERIGITDNFFELGGHSLKAAAIVLKVSKDLGINLQISELFRQPTVEDLAIYMRKKQKNDYVEIQPVAKQDYYPVSSQQMRLFILWQLERESKAYNLPSGMIIEGDLDQEKLIDTFTHLIQRHESLRTSFRFVDGQLVQYIHKTVDFKVDYAEIIEQEMIDAAKSFVKPFDLENSPLFRVKLFKVGENKHLLLTDTHHIVFDGISFDIIMKEFSVLYSGGNLTEPKLQYKDYAVWQEQFFKRDEYTKKEAFWLNMLEEIPVLQLHTDYPRTTIQDFAGESVSITVNAELTSQLRVMSTETGTTLYMLLLTVLNVLMSKYTHQEDILIGSPTAGRSHYGLEDVIGMFVNTVVMRNFPSREKTFRELLEEVKENTLKALDHEDYPFEVLVDKLGIERNPGRNPIFDILFSLDSNGNSSTDTEALSFQKLQVESNATQFDIAIQAIEKKDTIEFLFKYRTKLFAEDTIERMANHFIQLLSNIQDMHTPLKEIKVMSEREEQIIISDYNRTQADYPNHSTIHELVGWQMKETPSHIAVSCKERVLTYFDLDRKTNQLARVLRKRGVQRNSIVAIIAEPSLEMIIGVLGVLKAGGAYLPIDPSFPLSRMKYMLQDSGCSLILTQNHLYEGLAFKQEVMKLNEEIICLEDDSVLENLNQPDDLAYVLYTSGTTGNPKGVMVEHKNIVNQLTGLIECLQFNKTLHHILLAKFTFDVSVQQILLPLLTGGKLFIPDLSMMAEPEKLWSYIEQNDIHVLGTVPALMKVLLNHINTSPRFHYVMLAGEVFTKNLYDELRNKVVVDQIINLYGPTETTIYATMYICNGKEERMTIPIGKPLPNYRTYILDAHHRLVPLGVTGELCIAGVGVARGYIGNPDLTDERYVPDPFFSGEKMYKTGDHARWLPDGNIEYIGRHDHQVKIKGIRIELDEIKDQLMHHRHVNDAVVVAKENQSAESFLCAYVVTEGMITATELREHLAKHLPEYMIPSYFVKLEHLPFTTSGKVDVKALQERKDESYLPRGTAYTKPATQLEKAIVNIWKQVLGVEQVGIHDHFFELGGKSLNILLVNKLLKEELNIDLPVVTLFRHTTIHSLVQQIKMKHDESEPALMETDREKVMEESKNRLARRRKKMQGKGN